MKSTAFRLAAPVAVALFAALAGCESKLTDERFARLKPGISQDEVERILGVGAGKDETPSGVSLSGSGVSGSRGSTTVYVYKSGDREVTVTYADGKVKDVNKRGF